MSLAATTHNLFVSTVSTENTLSFVHRLPICILTFSCISEVDCASQNATVATSFSMGISTEQSLPSRRATRGRECMGPLGMGPRMLPLSILGRLPGCIILAFRLSIRLKQDSTAKGDKLSWDEILRKETHPVPKAKKMRLFQITRII